MDAFELLIRASQPLNDFPMGSGASPKRTNPTSGHFQTNMFDPIDSIMMLADQAVKQNPINSNSSTTSAQIHTPQTHNEYGPYFASNHMNERRMRAMSEPWTTQDAMTASLKYLNPTNGAVKPLTSNNSGTAILLAQLESASLPSMLDRYSAIYNKNGRVGIYTKEERLAIINRFKEKRKRRVWKKKIRYSCRKNLADRRVRVKGRFVRAAGGVRITANGLTDANGNPLPDEEADGSGDNDNEDENSEEQEDVVDYEGQNGEEHKLVFRLKRSANSKSGTGNGPAVPSLPVISGGLDLLSFAGLAAAPQFAFSNGAVVAPVGTSSPLAVATDPPFTINTKSSSYNYNIRAGKDRGEGVATACTDTEHGSFDHTPSGATMAECGSEESVPMVPSSPLRGSHHRDNRSNVSSNNGGSSSNNNQQCKLDLLSSVLLGQYHHHHVDDANASFSSEQSTNSGDEADGDEEGGEEGGGQQETDRLANRRKIRRHSIAY